MVVRVHSPLYPFFFFNDTATTEIYTLSLHDALPISLAVTPMGTTTMNAQDTPKSFYEMKTDRKSTRLNSSHGYISYAVFCLKKKKWTKYKYMIPLTKKNTNIPPISLDIANANPPLFS